MRESLQEHYAPLFFFPNEAKAYNCANCAILIQIIRTQIGYAVDHFNYKQVNSDFYKFKNEIIFVKLSHEDFKRKMPWASTSSIKRIIKKLKDLDLISARQLSLDKGDSSNWYTINSMRFETKEGKVQMKLK